MFGVSFTELLVIAVVALIVVGPDQLPEVLKAAGKFAGIIQRELDGIRRDFFNSVYTDSIYTQAKANEVTPRIEAATRELVAPPVEKMPSEHQNEEHDGNAV